MRVLRFEKMRAMDLLKSDCEGIRRRAFFWFRDCGASHGRETCLSACAWLTMRRICGPVRSAMLIRCGTGDIVTVNVSVTVQILHLAKKFPANLLSQEWSKSRTRFASCALIRSDHLLRGSP